MRISDWSSDVCSSDCLGGSDEGVVRYVHRRGEVAETLADPVAEGLRFDTGDLGRFLDLLAMLVSAGQEHHVTAVEPLEARQHVAGQRRVGMPDMRLVVDVIDRRRDEIGRASCRERVCQYV